MNTIQKIFFGVLFLHICAWIAIRVLGLKTTDWNYLYAFSYGLIPLFGGLFGLNAAMEWAKSVTGKGIFYVSLGLISWALGNIAWSFYNFFLSQSIPYPSLADVGYVLAIPLWFVGMIQFARAAGAGAALQNKKTKTLIFLIPLIVISVSYYLLVIVARGGVLSANTNNYIKLFFDLAYPTGDVIILSVTAIVFVLSLNYFRGVYALSLLVLLVGFVCMYAADFLFAYTTTLNTYYNGNIADLFFTIALSCIAVGVLGFTKSS